MSVRTFATPIAEFHGESMATSTTITGKGFPPGAVEVMLDDAADWRGQFGPRIEKCLVTDDSGATFTDYTAKVRDRDTSTSLILDSLDTATNGGYWYLAAKYKFSGAAVTVGAVNGTTSTMTGYYWNGSAWGDVSITDNTASAGAALGQDGKTIAFTVPSDWEAITLDGVENLYVIRFQVTVQLDSEVEVDEIALIPDTTASPAGYFNKDTDYVMTLDTAVNGSICAYLSTSTSTLYITWMRHTKRGSS